MDNKEKLLLIKKRLSERLGDTNVRELVVAINQLNEEVKSRPPVNVNLPQQIWEQIVAKFPDKIEAKATFPEKMKIDWSGRPNEPDKDWNKLIALLEKIKLPEKIGVDWGKVPEDFKAKKEKGTQKVQVDGLDQLFKQSIEKIQSSKEIPDDVAMVVENNLWKSVSINYPNKTLKVDITRNRSDIITKLKFNVINSNNS